MAVNFGLKRFLTSNRKHSAGVLLAVAGFLCLAVLSLRMLHEPYYGYAFGSSFMRFGEVLSVTGWAALRVWGFWGIATTLLALFLLNVDSELELGDALLGGAAGTWIFAYVAGNLLGPIGLFRTTTIWLLVIAAAIWLWRHPPIVKIGALSTGQKLALLACALMAVGTLPLQLGCPIPPYMDVLSIPASAQRVVTFSKYIPFDSDPYGYWTPLAQTPGLELFYAMLALGSFSHLAVVAEMAALVPMSCLIIFATYRLGRALMGDVAGGIASLLLLTTSLLSRVESMRGTAVAFALGALGLAFFIDPERRPIKTAIAGLALGTAIASHAIVGGLMLAAAAGTLLVEVLAGDAEDALAEAGCLMGALLVAVPEFAVARTVRLFYPILPFAQFAGIAIIYYSADLLHTRPIERTTFSRWLAVSIVLATLLLLVWRPLPLVMLGGLSDSFPAMLLLCIGGLAILLLEWNRATGVWLVGIAFLLAIFAEYATACGLFASGETVQAFGLSDLIHKIGEYWYPYFLIFPAAALFDWIGRRWSKPLALGVLLVFVMVPWSQRPDLDPSYMERSIVQNWAFDWLVAKQGWWGDTPDTRWAQSRAELALSDKLRDEIAAGRITFATHIVHVTPNTNMSEDILLFSLYTGINDDLYVVRPSARLDEGGTAGSRLHPVTILPAAMAKRPPYLVVHNLPPTGLSLPPNGYDEIFNQGGVRLFRRMDLAPRAHNLLSPRKGVAILRRPNFGSP